MNGNLYRVMSAAPRTAMVIIFALLLLVPPAMPAGADSDGALRADVPAGCYLSEKANFTLIHLEGDPATIGRNHGALLADKIERGIAAYAHCSSDWYGLTWAQCRKNAVFYWPNVPAEYQTEIQGIADGAASQGVTNPDGATVDWIDILAYNAIWDIWWRVSLPGNKYWWFPFRDDGTERPHHCSGFVATGKDWTADGGFVLAQSLWMPYWLPPAQAVWCDLVPARGNRIFMQLTAGLVWSGTEYYVNSAGLVAAETTLGVGAHVWGGTPAFVRIRRAIQYATTIDEFRDQMLQDTNGAYCSDYLLGDAKTGEVAVLELGGRTWAIARTTNGYLPSCNYPWDSAVADEMGEPQGAANGCWPRWTRIQDLCEQNKGNITVDFGKRLLADHYDSASGCDNRSGRSLCGHGENTTSGYPHGSQDAKVTNQSMAARMQVWARFGHSWGEPYIVEDHAALHPNQITPDLQDMIAGPWATFGAFNPLQVTVLDENGAKVGDARVVAQDAYDGTRTVINVTGGTALVDFFPTGRYIFTARSGGAQVRSVVSVSGPASVDLVLHGEGRPAPVAGAQAAAAAVVAAVVLAAVAWRRKGSRAKSGR
jgi:hypothetical protein